MGPNEQKQHFSELRQKVCLYKHLVVLQRGLPSLITNSNVLLDESGKSECQSHTDYRAFLQCSLEPNLQFSLRYFVNLSLIPKLYSEESKVQKTYVKEISRHNLVISFLYDSFKNNFCFHYSYLQRKSIMSLRSNRCRKTLSS